MRLSSWKNTIFSVTPRGHRLLLRSSHVQANLPACGVATFISLLLEFQSRLQHLCLFVLKTHHRPAVFHQVDAHDAQERSKTQLRAQRRQKHF